MQDSTGPHRWQKLAEAADFAFQIHAPQMRKGTAIPYISHLMAVAALVLEHGGDQDQAIAGLLHDAIEDVGVAHEQAIAVRFGNRVAHIVRGCSDTDVQPKPPWRTRKLAYLGHLEEADYDVLLVSACDKLHNARALLTDLCTHGAVLFQRFNASAADTPWLYGELASVFQRRLPGSLARELALTVHTLHQLAAEMAVG